MGVGIEWYLIWKLIEFYFQYTNSFIRPQTWKSKRIRSGDLAGYRISPYRSFKKMLVQKISEQRDLNVLETEVWKALHHILIENCTNSKFQLDHIWIHNYCSDKRIAERKFWESLNKPRQFFGRMASEISKFDPTRFFSLWFTEAKSLEMQTTSNTRTAG